MKYFIGKILKPVLLAAVMLLAVRFLLLAHMRIPADNAACGLQKGQHVLVCLTYYGLRLPLESWTGYHRLGEWMPGQGERLVYRRNGEKQASVGICRALPGYTVWFDPQRKRVLPARTSPDAQQVVIPRKGQSVSVTPNSAHFYAYLLNRYEQVLADVADNGELRVNCNEMSTIRLSKNYYWVETSADVYDIIPHEALVGKIVYVTKRKF